MELKSWQIQMIIQMYNKGFNIFEIEEKTGVPLIEIKQILKL